MEKIEKMVFEIIGRTSKQRLMKELGISAPTLDKRIKDGGWLKKEVEVIEKLSNDL